MSPTHPSLLALPYTLLFPWSCPGPSPREEEGELGFLKRTADLAKSRLTSVHSSSCQQLQDCSKPRAVSPGSIVAVRIEAVGPCLPALTPHPSRRAPHLRVKVDSCVTLVGRSLWSPLLTPLPALPGDQGSPRPQVGRKQGAARTCSGACSGQGAQTCRNQPRLQCDSCPESPGSQLAHWPVTRNLACPTTKPRTSCHPGR